MSITYSDAYLWSTSFFLAAFQFVQLVKSKKGVIYESSLENDSSKTFLCSNDAYVMNRARIRVRSVNSTGIFAGQKIPVEYIPVEYIPLEYSIPVEYIPLEFFHWNLLFPLFLSTLLRERERASESKRSESEEEEEAALSNASPPPPPPPPPPLLRSSGS